MITGIHHVQITIPGGAEQQAREFYCRVLGLPEIAKPEALRQRGGIWVQAGDRQLHIGTESGVDRSQTKAHVAYQVDDLAAWRQRLAKRDIEMFEAVPIPGFQRLEFRDPFGNRVELVQPDEQQERTQ